MNQTLLFEDTQLMPADSADPSAGTATTVPLDHSSGTAGAAPATGGTQSASGRRLAVLGIAALIAAGWFIVGGMNKSVISDKSGTRSLASSTQTLNPAASLVSRRPATTADDLLAGSFASSSPDGRLMQLYAYLAGVPPNAETRKNLTDEARQLSVDVPNFSLAQLAYADLLSAQGSSAKGFATLPPGQVAGSPERLEELLSEARARVDGTAHRPAAGTIPEQLVYLSANVRHAVAVDVSRSRVYLFENTPNGLVLKHDYYASIGKLGTSKRTEGDMRTPLGVYFVTGQIQRPRLADRFGEQALTLNYPNQYDQMHGRTGSGIWLHGTESGLYSRAPLATDGCVSFANIDLRELAAFIEKQGTPIVIADRLSWVKSSAGSNGSNADQGFLKTFDAWRAARQGASLESQLKFYSSGQRTPAVATAGSWAELLRSEREKPGTPAPTVDNLSIVGFRDQGDMMIVTYTEAFAGSPHGRLKRQYWSREPAGWAIIYEGAIG